MPTLFAEQTWAAWMAIMSLSSSSLLGPASSSAACSAPGVSSLPRSASASALSDAGTRRSVGRFCFCSSRLVRDLQPCVAASSSVLLGGGFSVPDAFRVRYCACFVRSRAYLAPWSSLGAAGAALSAACFWVKASASRLASSSSSFCELVEIFEVFVIPIVVFADGEVGQHAASEPDVKDVANHGCQNDDLPEGEDQATAIGMDAAGAAGFRVFAAARLFRDGGCCEAQARSAAERADEVTYGTTNDTADIGGVATNRLVSAVLYVEISAQRFGTEFGIENFVARKVVALSELGRQVGGHLGDAVRNGDQDQGDAHIADELVGLGADGFEGVDDIVEQQPCLRTATTAGPTKMAKAVPMLRRTVKRLNSQPKG